MAFTPPKRDIVEMMTPPKQPISTAITPYRENRSLLDFAIGGTPQRPKTEQDIKEQKRNDRLKQLQKIKKMNVKQLFEYNTLKTDMPGQPDPNPIIASTMLNKAMRSHLARKDYKAAQETYDPYAHQENIRDKRKEFARITSSKTASLIAKDIARKKFNKTQHVYKAKSNAGRPPTNPYAGLKQTNI